MTKGDLKILIKKIQNECGLEDVSKVTYFWKEDGKLAFKFFFDSLALPEELKLDVEKVKNQFSTQNAYEYLDDFEITDLNTRSGYIEVVPDDQNFKVINSYKDANEADDEVKENRVLLAGPRLNETFAKNKGYILQEDEDKNQNQIVYVYAKSNLIGQQEAPLLKNAMINLIKNCKENAEKGIVPKNTVFKLCIGDGWDEMHSVTRAINNYNTNLIAHEAFNKEYDVLKDLILFDYKDYTDAMLAAGKDRSMIIKISEDETPAKLQGLETVEDAQLTVDDWRNIESLGKQDADTINQYLDEFLKKFVEEALGTDPNKDTPFKARYKKACEGDAKSEPEKVEPEKVEPEEVKPEPVEGAEESNSEESANSETEETAAQKDKEVEDNMDDNQKMTNAIAAAKDLSPYWAYGIEWGMQQLELNKPVNISKEDYEEVVKNSNLKKIAGFNSKETKTPEELLDNFKKETIELSSLGKTAAQGTDAMEGGSAFDISGVTSDTSGPDLDKNQKEDNSIDLTRALYTVYCLIHKDEYEPNVINKISIPQGAK